MPLTAALCSVAHRSLATPILDLLADNGIDAFVKSDDCGGVDPALAFSNGTLVMVAPQNLERARELHAQFEAAPRIGWEEDSVADQAAPTG